MTQGKHQDDDKRRRRGLWKLIPSTGLGWTLWAGGAGIALAAFLILNGVSGTVNVGSADVDYSFASAGDPVDILAGICTASYQGPDEISISWGPLPGETCEVEPDFVAAAGTTRDLVLQEFVAPAGINATLGAWCGNGSIITAGTTSPVSAKVVLELDPGVAQGTVINWDALADGFKWTTVEEYDPAACS